MDKQELEDQNCRFSNTDAVSCNNKDKGFLPAFRDEDSGRVELARFVDGRPAPMHLIIGLPKSWAIEFDDNGAISVIKTSITAGFVRDGVFFTRDETIEACGD